MNNALTALENSGPVGRRLVEFFHERDDMLTPDVWSGIYEFYDCPSPFANLVEHFSGIRIAFVPFSSYDIYALAIALPPGAIYIDNMSPGYSGQTPSSAAVVTFGHEISHLAQGIYAFSVQAEMLATVVGYYLEDELGVAHRSDARFIVEEQQLDPWHQADIEKYKENYSLPWPLMIGRGLSSNWLRKWSISLGYLNPPTSRESGIPGSGR